MNKDHIPETALSYVDELLRVTDEAHWEPTLLPLAKKLNKILPDKIEDRVLNRKWRSLTEYIKNTQLDSAKQKMANGLIHVGDLLNEPKEESKWLINDLVPEGGITVLSGDPGSYKTWVVLHMAISIANGQPVFGRFTSLRKNVLVVDEEDPRSLIKDRLRMMSCDQKSALYFLIHKGIKVDVDFGLSDIEGAITRQNVGVVFIDSLIRIHSGNENDSKDIAAVFEKLRSLTSKGVTVIVTHHNRKAPIGSSYDRQPLRGSGDILAAVDCNLSIKKKDENVLKISQPKLRIAREIQSFLVGVTATSENLSLTFKEFDDSKPEERVSKKQEAIELIEPLLAEQGNVERSALVEAIKIKGVGVNAIDDAIHELEAEGKVVAAKGGKGKKILRLAE